MNHKYKTQAMPRDNMTWLVLLKLFTENIRNNLITKDLGNKKLVKHVKNYIEV